MEVFQIVILALVQGVTEFLPISSSAHLLLPSSLLGWPDQGLAFDVAVHVGSLLAVIIYFRDDILRLISAWFGGFNRDRELSISQQQDCRLAWFIILATIPAGLAGLLFNDFIEAHLRSIAVVALTTIVFGLLLLAADSRHSRVLDSNVKTLANLTVKTVIFIGICQAFALIPGTSRSGVTITAALFLGIGRTDAARFSFLLSIPIIVLSGGFKALELLNESSVPWLELLLGASLSAISAYACIHYFLSYINRLGMLPFVIYRLGLGGVLAWIAWSV